MTMKRMLGVIAVLGASAVVGLAQKPKSQKEVEAIQAVIGAQNADARIAAVESLIEKFHDTEFKSWAYNVAGEAAQSKRDTPKTVFYYEQALKADPKSYQAMLSLAGVIAQTTKEFDLDKDEKLAKSEKYAKEAMALIPATAKPNPNLTDAQWDAIKKDDMAQAHIDLGLIATVRKQHDVAINEYKTAAEGASEPDAIALVRLAGAYTDAGQIDNAISTLDKALAVPSITAQIKQVAEGEKARLAKLKK